VFHIAIAPGRRTVPSPGALTTRPPLWRLTGKLMRGADAGTLAPGSSDAATNRCFA
jgi:hypothetical protein